MRTGDAPDQFKHCGDAVELGTCGAHAWIIRHKSDRIVTVIFWGLPTRYSGREQKSTERRRLGESSDGPAQIERGAKRVEQEVPSRSGLRPRIAEFEVIVELVREVGTISAKIAECHRPVFELSLGIGFVEDLDHVVVTRVCFDGCVQVAYGGLGSLQDLHEVAVLIEQCAGQPTVGIVLTAVVEQDSKLRDSEGAGGRTDVGDEERHLPTVAASACI